MWTEKHEEYCLKQKLRPSSRLIWQWLIREGIEEEPDLKDFNKWAKKHRGKPYHRDSIKLAWQQLIDVGIISPLKEYSWHVWRISVKPLEFLLNPKPRKKSGPRKSDRDLQPETLDTANDSYHTTTTSSNSSPDTETLAPDQKAVLKAAEVLGVEFKDPRSILKFKAEEVLKALEMFAIHRAKKEIFNPQGWVIRCIQGQWWESLSDNWQSFVSPTASGLLGTVKSVISKKQSLAT